MKKIKCILYVHLYSMYVIALKLLTFKNEDVSDQICFRLYKYYNIIISNEYIGSSMPHRRRMSLSSWPPFSPRLLISLPKRGKLKRNEIWAKNYSYEYFKHCTIHSAHPPTLLLKIKYIFWLYHVFISQVGTCAFFRTIALIRSHQKRKCRITKPWKIKRKQKDKKSISKSIWYKYNKKGWLLWRSNSS